MKKIAMTVLMCVSVLLMVFLTGCSKTPTFESVTDSQLFSSVPLVSGEKITFSDVNDVGGGDYQIWAYDATLSEYQSYGTLLEKEGYKKYADNGENGIEGYVYISHYLKDKLLVVTTYYTRLGDMTVTVSENTALSEYLIYDESYVANNKPDAKTTLTMQELYVAGNSFIFQLKDGSFIINDGGQEDDLPYLLDYLESLTPDGQKPVVKAWVVTHSHADHMGVFVAFSKNATWANRICVENVYFTEASTVAHEMTNASVSALTFYSKSIPSTFKNSEGKAPNVYRMRQGERYYFNDITMDVVYEQAILSHKDWKTWNATSTALMYTIEGQKVFLTADIDYECQMRILDIFPDEYFKLAVYQTPHHGGNVYNNFTFHLTVGTVLYARYQLNAAVSGLQARWDQGNFLKERAEETLGWLEGGVRLTFPYTTGTYERLPLIEWKYNKEVPARFQTK